MKFLRLAILALVLAGCDSSNDARLVGHYEPVIIPPPGTSQNEVIQAISKLSSLYALDLKEGHQFSIPGQQLNGTWELRDNKVTLTPEGATNVGGGTTFYYEKDGK